jgi:hypothetical protein
MIMQANAPKIKFRPFRLESKDAVQGAFSFKNPEQLIEVP